MIPCLKNIDNEIEGELYYRLIPEIIPEDKYLFLPGDVCDNIIIIEDGEMELSFIINDICD